ncbi:MAG TPA: hypothetical protein VFC19_36975 [Candidatus Limnocylindrales bacterium]|nr:hypothetical protein [Candidatus Limnocylindrales bacterium]
MDIFLSGVAPEHAAALIAGLVALAVIPFLKNAKGDHVDRWAATLLGFTAAVHLFLPFGHLGRLTVPYLLSAFGFGALALGAHLGRRRWRLGAGILCPATVIAYLIWGGDIDQVGILTALVELTILGLALSHRKVLCGIATVLAVLLSGAVMWIASFKAHFAADAGTASPTVGHHHGDQHEHLARAQAGVIMRPLGENRGASSAETSAAISLAQATVSAGTKYKRLSDAIAAGYRYPLGAREGMDVHMENPEFKKDGRVLDPERPEMLVYAIEGGKATLLGVVFVMERAGQAGPAPGGSITRWHAHNLCLSFAPIGIGIVTPYGGCPTLSIPITIPEMMHIWIVNPPGGPYAEGVDKDWALGYHREHGVTL